MILGVLILTAMVMLNLNSRLSELFKIRSQLAVAQAEYDVVLAENKRLKEKVAYAQSDQAVDEWARRQGHMAKPGDRVIVPIPDKNARYASTPAPILEPHQTENWEIWQMLFFGE